MLTSSKTAQGEFDSTKGKIVINLARGDFFATALHEVTHYISLNAPKEEYNAFKNEIVRWLMARGMLKQYLDKYASMYGDNVATVDDLTEEVVANAAEALIKSDTFLEQLMLDEDFIGFVSNNKAKSFIKRVMDKLGNLVKALKSYLKSADMNHSIARDIAQDVSELEKVSELWTKAFKSAVENHSELQSIAKENTDTESSGGRYSIEESFIQRLDKWDKKTIGFSFVVGQTSDALQKAGVPQKQIRWDASKISKLLNKHSGMDIDVIKKIPNLLENPILVIDSKKGSNSKIVMGDVYDTHGKIVTVVLLLTPTSSKGNVLDYFKISSAEGRGHIKSLFTYDDNSPVPVRYVDKKRIQSWLNVNGLQLPLHNLDLDSDLSISQPPGIVNPDSKKSLPETDSKGNELTEQQK